MERLPFAAYDADRCWHRPRLAGLFPGALITLLRQSVDASSPGCDALDFET